jgi:hypothetical protein
MIEEDLNSTQNSRWSHFDCYIINVASSKIIHNLNMRCDYGIKAFYWSMDLRRNWNGGLKSEW